MWYGEVDIMKSPTLSPNDSSAQLRSCDFRRNFRRLPLNILSTPAFKPKPLMYCRRFSTLLLWPEKPGTNFTCSWDGESLRDINRGYLLVFFLHSKRSRSWILFRILVACK